MHRDATGGHAGGPPDPHLAPGPLPPGPQWSAPPGGNDQSAPPLRVGSAPVLLALVAWLGATAAAAVFVLLPREKLQQAFTTPFPFEARPTPDMFGSAYLIGLLISVPCGVLIYVAAPAVHRRFQRDGLLRRRFRTTAGWVAVAVASGTPALPLALIAVPNPPGLTLAVPGALYAIWVLHRLQRHRRLPVPISLAAFGWGMTFAMTAGLLLQTLHNVVALLYFPDLLPASQPELGQISNPWIVTEVSAPLWEEFAKGAGVVLIFHLLRRRYDGVVHGIVIGAMVGAGFNFIETVRFAIYTFDLAMTQIYLRQWVSGFVFGHVLFTGLFGATVAISYRYADKARRILVPAAGLGLAVLAHFLWNHLSTELPWQSGNPMVDLYAAMPMNYLTISGPFLVIVLVLLWFGLRREAAALRVALPVEAMTGYDAITPDEALTLSNPNRRLGRRLRAVRSSGPLAYFQVGRLHAVQLDLAMERWRLAHEPGRVSPESEERLRERVLRCKRALLTPPRQ